MATLSEIKAACAAYHTKTAADFTVNGVDLFLVAANNARRNAELRHNFEYARCRATLSIDPQNGGALSAAVIDGNTAADAPSVVVSGATLPASANGTYHRANGLLGGVNYYVSLGAEQESWLLYYDTTAWHIVNFHDYPGLLEGFGDWSLTASSATPVGTYTANNGATGAAVVTAASGSVFSGIKEVTAITRTRASGAHVPVDFTRVDIAIERERYELELSDDLWPGNRYPSDAQILMQGSTSTLIQQGRTIFIYPADTTSDDALDVYLYGYGMLSDYITADLSDTSPSDFFVEFGADYLQWSVICEINYLWKTFVPRTEGNLSPPEQAREKAWRDLLLWDTYLVDSNSTRSR